jgi:hypothetical protein
MPACGSPQLFAACHVLLRRLVPWHPPCALVRLISFPGILRPILISPAFTAVYLQLALPFCFIPYYWFSLVISMCSCQGTRACCCTPPPAGLRPWVRQGDPENDTGWKRDFDSCPIRVRIAWNFRSFICHGLLHDRPGIKRSISRALVSLERR